MFADTHTAVSMTSQIACPRRGRAVVFKALFAAFVLDRGNKWPVAHAACQPRTNCKVLW
jgi:hypothetical protein